MHTNFDYEHGDCALYAVELAKKTGFKLCALVEYDEDLESTVLIHAYVRKDSETIIDSTGETTLNYVMDKYPWTNEPEEIEIKPEPLLFLNYGKNIPDSSDARFKIEAQFNLGSNELNM